jgi:hypothetical protein
MGRLLGWIFAGQAWFIDVNVANWTAYTVGSLLSVICRMIVNGICGALAGWILALMYNAAADFMGGIKINLEWRQPPGVFRVGPGHVLR